MNIAQAKEQIQNTVTAYMTRDKLGQYAIPVEKQRPVFLMGPPGVGKTAIMDQIASEMGIGLVSYSMTHHTRQSALGLPLISRKTYQGEEFDVSEYTMSEIIASIYDMMENTGVKNGILFLDEINCVSETLTPLMLQFLQYKVFGRHSVPEGWTVVTAGNPPEYNNSVHEFDIVTWDRLKRIDVEPDFSAWKEYAYARNVHPSVLTFLETKQDAFYKVESTINGKNFVTARGWDDLSAMIQLYEANNIPVDLKLISQYIQNKSVAREFAVYYDLFKKYRSDYQIDGILKGKPAKGILERARKAKFDERYALVGLILDATRLEVAKIEEEQMLYTDFFEFLKAMKMAMTSRDFSVRDFFGQYIQKLDTEYKNGKESKSLSSSRLNGLLAMEQYLDEIRSEYADLDGQEAFGKLMDIYKKKNRDLKRSVKAAQKTFGNVFKFIEDAFGNGQEMLILVTEMTVDPATSAFITKYGVKEYFDHNKDLLFHEREHRIEQALLDLDNLSLDELGL